MGDIHVRNVRAESGGTSHTWIERVELWMMRELFAIGRWQEIAIDADPAWNSASNILLSLSDLDVQISSGMEVTSVTGGFSSSHEDLMLTLYASDDGNRGVYNIRKVINSNTLLVDERTRAGSWASNEGSISGRIHKAAAGLPFTGTGSFLVVQAPVASGHNLQLHFTHDGYDNMFVKAYPNGDYGGAALDTDQWTIARATEVMRYNAFFADAVASEFYALLYAYNSGTTYYYPMVAGVLTDEAAGDSDPGFLSYTTGWGTLADNSAMYMLNELSVKTSFYPTFQKSYETQNETAKRESQISCKKINGGKAKVFRPVIIGENTADGGFVRGNHPMSFCHVSYPEDEFGLSWWKMGTANALVPRDGPNDVAPLASTAV